MKQFIYRLPLTRGWHARTELATDRRSMFRYFGANWWDLVASGKWKESKYFGRDRIVIPSIDTYTTGIVIINMCDKPMTVIQKSKNAEVKYYIKRYGTVMYNRMDRNEVVLCKGLMNFVRCGDCYMLLLGVDSLVGIVKTELYKNFMLACGIVNENLYYNTVGLNAYVNKIVVRGGVINVDDNESMYDWVRLCSEHWGRVNPASRLSSGGSIPGLIHFIWLSKVPGGSANPLKPKFKKYIASWINRNPECKCMIWTDSRTEFSVPVRGMIVKYGSDILEIIKKLPKHMQRNLTRLYKRHPNVGIRADTLRQMILYVMGGMYADVNDMSCIMPMKNFRKKFDFIAGMEPMMYVNNAFVAAKPRHIIQRNFLEYISQNSSTFLRDWDPKLETEEKDNLVVSQTGPIAFSGILFGLLDKGSRYMKRSCILPSSWVYPNYQITSEPESWLKPVSITSHYDQRDYLKPN